MASIAMIWMKTTIMTIRTIKGDSHTRERGRYGRQRLKWIHGASPSPLSSSPPTPPPTPSSSLPPPTPSSSPVTPPPTPSSSSGTQNMILSSSSVNETQIQSLIKFMKITRNTGQFRQYSDHNVGVNFWLSCLFWPIMIRGNNWEGTYFLGKASYLL